MFGKEKEENNETTAPVIEKATKVYGSFLEDRVLKVKPVESSGKWTGLLVAGQEKKKEPFLFDKVKRSYQVPLNNAARGGGVKVVLDNQKRVLIKRYEAKYPEGMTEQEFFEEELGTDLNPRLPKEENFWRTDKRGRVTLTREGMPLNLNNAIDMIRYKILMANPKKIAPSFDERGNSLSYEFMIINETHVTNKQLEEADKEARAFTKFTEITRDENSMLGFIKALGRTVPGNYTKTWLKAEILKELKKDFSKFLSVVEDPLFNDKILVQEAVNVGALKKINNRRYTTDGGVELGDLMSTISWINNPDNQEARLRIKNQIDMSKK